MKKLFLILGMLFAGIALVMPQNKLEDSKIEDAIENEYRFDHAVNINKIDIGVKDGIVELTGTVDNIQAKERATKIAELVKGVRTVSNRIEVMSVDNLTDSEIKYEVETALLKDPAADAYELGVSVTDNIVTITGTVDSYQEKELSADVAKSVSGVVALNNQIEIEYKAKRSDKEIKNDIEGALKWNVMVDDGLINVKVNNSEVALSGIVGSAAEKSNAFFTSWVSGVKSVNNEDLKVQWWASDEDLRKNKYVTVSDKEIEDAILEATLYDPRVFSFEIDPEVEHGWVTLRGTVNNMKAKISAEKLAENTTGVTGVTNRIKVKADQWVRDSELQRNIKTALENNSITEAWEVKVDVHGGIATLTGVVDSWKEYQKAAENAWQGGAWTVSNMLVVR